METIFTYCAGYMCSEKQGCLRWHKHKELMDNKIDTRKKEYIDSVLCVKYNHTNFIPESVYAQSKFVTTP